MTKKSNIYIFPGIIFIERDKSGTNCLECLPRFDDFSSAGQRDL
jgi:hypothetical protein